MEVPTSSPTSPDVAQPLLSIVVLRLAYPLMASPSKHNLHLLFDDIEEN